MKQSEITHWPSLLFPESEVENFPCARKLATDPEFSFVHYLYWRTQGYLSAAGSRFFLQQGYEEQQKKSRSILGVGSLGKSHTYFASWQIYL